MDSTASSDVEFRVLHASLETKTWKAVKMIFNLRLLRSFIAIAVIAFLSIAYDPFTLYPFTSFKVSGAVADTAGHGLPGHTLRLYIRQLGAWSPATSDTNFSYRLFTSTDSTGKFWLRAVVRDNSFGYWGPSDVGVTLDGSDTLHFRLLYHLANYTPKWYPKEPEYGNTSTGCKSCKQPVEASPLQPPNGRIYDFPDTTIVL